MRSSNWQRDLSEPIELLERVLLDARKTIERGVVQPLVVHLMFRFARQAAFALQGESPEELHQVLSGFERAVDQARRGHRACDEQLLEAGLNSVRAMKAYLEDNSDTFQLAALAEHLAKLSETGALAAPQKVSFPLTTSQAELLRAAKLVERRTFVVSKTISTRLEERAFAELLVFRHLRASSATVIGWFPTYSELVRNTEDTSLLQVLFASDAPVEELRRTLYDPVELVDFEVKDSKARPDSNTIENNSSREPRVLVVEDEIVSRRVLSSMLSKYGSCDVGVDGLEGVILYMLALEEQRPYDIILLDIDLPYLDGRGVLKTIRRTEQEQGGIIPAPVPVVMATGSDEGEDIFGSFKEGCEGYLVKPIDHSKLKALLGKLGFGPLQPSEKGEVR